MEIDRDWIQINSQSDIETLLKVFGEFHDACLRELHLCTGSSVNKNLSMAVGLGWDYHAKVLFQRQWNNPCAIEISFDEIRKINLAPSPPNHDSSIFSATLLLEDDVVYWADVGNWRPEDPDCNDASWIAAGRVKWRDKSEWIGEAPRYGSFPDSREEL